MIDLSMLSYDEFVKYVFLHNNLYHKSEVNDWKGDAQVILIYCIRLFKDGKELWRRFEKERLHEGFDFISGSCGFFFLPADPSASLDTGKQFYESMAALFADVFAIDPLQNVSFMWFERTTVWSLNRKSGKSTIDDPVLRQAMLAALRDILRLPSKTCQMAALHGLNELHHPEPRANIETINEFLDAKLAIDCEVEEYARVCRGGRRQ